MDYSWINLIFGWPALVVAVGMSLLGIYLRRPIIPAISALISVPHAVYLGLTPLFSYAGFGLPIFHLLAGYALKKHRERVALFVLFPFIIYTLWLVIVITGQSTPVLP